MMMERAKTAPAPEPTTSTELEKPQAASAPAPDVNASAEDRVQDLERRLDMLGGESTAPPAPAPTAATTTPAPAAAPEKPKETQTGKNNPLLKRIQAAQERARQAEQKEKEAKAAAAAEIERKKHDEEQAKLRAAEEEHIAKAQSALRSVASRAVEDKQKEIMMQLEGKAPTPTTMTAATTAASPEKATQGVPIMKTLDPPPPTFDSMKFPPTQQQPVVSNAMVGHGMNSRVLLQPPAPAAPPSFDFVEHQMMSTPVEQSSAPAPTAPSISPSAPPITLPEEDHLHGIMPVAPPQQQHQAAPPPPSFAEFEHQTQPSTDNAQTSSVPGEDEGVFDYDLDGNPLSPEQRQALLDEQRQLYESIMKEKAANDAAIAQANADSFDQRSSTAAARAMSPGSSSNTQSVRNEAMDAVGRDATATGEEGTEEDEEETRRRERRMVKIGNNQMVALHGQDRTKKAIKEGTAILVQCINCQNWMQVTDTATLMFCPVCQVVSPVIQQNEVMTKEEAIQLTMDRKLAEKLQAEAYADQDEEEDEEGERGAGEDEGFFGRMFGLSSSTTTAAPAATSGKAGAAGAQSDTWWDKISSVVSYGVADEGPRDRGDMGVSRPPGAPTAQYPANRRGSPTAAASRSPTHAEETRGLLSPVVDGNEANLPSGRVAESKPLFSCIADSMAGAASALYSTGEGDAEGNVHGVDSHSLLMTNAGRGVDGGDYSQLPNRE